MTRMCGYKKGGMVMDGEPDMEAPGLNGMPMTGGQKVMGAGNYKGQKGLGAAHGHKDMSGASLGHHPLPVGKKNGHKVL